MPPGGRREARRPRGWSFANMKKKIFISHASEDKDDLVRPLAEALKHDFDVWFDEYQLVVGSSLLEEISKGLASTDYGVVVLSKSFFGKKWPQRELNGLFNLEEKDKKIILPIWKGVTESDVRSYSPILADRLAAQFSDGIESIVSEIKRSISFFNRGKLVQGATSGLSKLRSTLEKRTEISRSKQIIATSAGFNIATDFAQSTISLMSQQITSVIQQGIIKGLRVQGPTSDEYQIMMNIWHGGLCLHAEYLKNNLNRDGEAEIDMSVINAEFDPLGNIQRHHEIERLQYSVYVTLSDDKLWKSHEGELITADILVSNWLDILAEAIENQ